MTVRIKPSETHYMYVDFKKSSNFWQIVKLNKCRWLIGEIVYKKERKNIQTNKQNKHTNKQTNKTKQTYKQTNTKTLNHRLVLQVMILLESIE